MSQKVNASQILVVIGAVALCVSLFLHWYDAGFEGGVSAWTAFEVADLLLAALALAAIATIVPIRRGRSAAPLVDSSWLPWIAGAVLVLVVVSLVNDPPAAHDLGLGTGAWIGLGAAVVIALGALLARAKISIVVGSRATK